MLPSSVVFLLRIKYITIDGKHKRPFWNACARLESISPYAHLPQIAHSCPLIYVHHKGGLSSYLHTRLNAFSYIINLIPKFYRVSKRPGSKVKRQKTDKEGWGYFSMTGKMRNVQKNQEFIQPLDMNYGSTS